MTMSASQFNRNCINFINTLEKSDQFDGVKSLLHQWKQKNKPAIGAINTFMKMAKLFQQDEDLVQQFNKCLVKQASIQKKHTTNTEVKQLAMQNQKSGHLLDAVFNWIKNDQTQKVQIVPIAVPIVISHKIQQLTQSQLMTRLESHKMYKSIAKILALYRRCVITLKQFKSMIEPIYLTDPSSFNMLFQYTQQLQTIRRKVTIFAPLNDLLDERYPVQQVGNSYIFIPDGYANYSKAWKINPQEKFLNRKICSVPIGSQETFVISKKNQYEQALFKNEEQKYQIDHNLCQIRGAIFIIQKGKPLNSPLLQKILAKVYPYENVFKIMLSSPQIARQIILPRLYQKLEQLKKCKQGFRKNCEEVSNKNFVKSLDYRCFYFRKNDKKFNATSRWQKQIQLRQLQIKMGIKNRDQQVTDRQAMQKTRNFVLNTFDNITKEQLIQDKQIDLCVFDKKQISSYPRYPHNQTLFLLSFQHQEVFNDVLEIILYHCQKKQIFELIALKLFKRMIKRVIVKDSSIVNLIEAKNLLLSNENNQNSNINNANSSPEPLNEPMTRKTKVYKDITEQFQELVQEQIQPLFLEELENPFEGPNQHTFIGTKMIYNFIRCLLTIYQRFLKAFQFSQTQRLQKKQLKQVSIYQQFISLMIFKVKDPKSNFEEYLRRLTGQQAFIYSTLDKLVLTATKMINNISPDTLTYRILKDNTRDYDNQLKKWSDYQFPSLTQQLTRVSRETEQLFRFTYTSTFILFISTWDNKEFLNIRQRKKDQSDIFGIEEPTFHFLTLHSDSKDNNSKNREVNTKKIILKQQCADYSHFGQSVLQMRGQSINLKRQTSSKLSEFGKELFRARKLIKLT